MHLHSICVCQAWGIKYLHACYLYLSISKVFAFVFVSADNNHSQRAQMPKQVSKKANFSAKIWKFLHTLENLTNTICICTEYAKMHIIRKIRHNTYEYEKAARIYAIRWGTIRTNDHGIQVIHVLLRITTLNQRIKQSIIAENSVLSHNTRIIRITAY